MIYDFKGTKIEIPITEEEWNQYGGVGLLDRYDFVDVMNYFCFVEYPKLIEKMKEYEKEHPNWREEEGDNE